MGDTRVRQTHLHTDQAPSTPSGCCLAFEESQFCFQPPSMPVFPSQLSPTTPFCSSALPVILVFHTSCLRFPLGCTGKRQVIKTDSLHTGTFSSPPGGKCRAQGQALRTSLSFYLDHFILGLHRDVCSVFLCPLHTHHHGFCHSEAGNEAREKVCD